MEPYFNHPWIFFTEIGPSLIKIMAPIYCWWGSNRALNRKLFPKYDHIHSFWTTLWRGSWLNNRQLACGNTPFLHIEIAHAPRHSIGHQPLALVTKMSSAYRMAIVGQPHSSALLARNKKNGTICSFHLNLIIATNKNCSEGDWTTNWRLQSLTFPTLWFATYFTGTDASMT